MPLFAERAVTPRFATLAPAFYSPVLPQPVTKPVLVSANHQAAKLLGIDPQQLYSDAFLQLMSGNSKLPGIQPLASVYAGHQFGSYNPQLGDGRALLLGGMETPQHGHWELQLKGAGQTPYSRFGDGRAVLRSTIREYLASEAMHGLGIPGTRALALINSETPVYREQQETAAILLRMAPSHIRFGHFEYFFYTERHDLLKQLSDFVITEHFPELQAQTAEQRYAAFFDTVVQRTASLVAQWQAQGFCHGVLNTDNMSILGLTIDYGPFAFMDDFEPGFICNHSDHHGRYAWNRQIQIGLWNLNALAHALSPLIQTEQLRDSLNRYEETLLNHYRQHMQNKLGLDQSEPEQDDQLISDILKLLATEKHDYHTFFRQLSEHTLPQCAALTDDFIDRNAWQQWFERYRQRQQQNSVNDVLRMQNMQQHNPKYVLRNYLAQQAIQQAESGDYQMVNDLLQVLQSPFDTHTGLEHLAAPPPAWGKKLEISCSS